MKLPVELHQQIVTFLASLPTISDSASQQAFIHSAGLDQRLEARILFGQATAQFFDLLVPQLLKYGTLEDDRHALVAVLETAKQYVGIDRQAECDQLIEAVRKVIEAAAQPRNKKKQSKLKTLLSSFSKKTDLTDTARLPESRRLRESEFDYDVFLSHNQADKPKVRELAERLQDAGLRVWFDEWVIKPGDDIFLSIEQGLEISRVLVLCLSPAALGSEWVSLERSTVLFRDPVNQDRRFVPLLLEECEPPATLKRYAYVDYREPGDEAFAKLLEACETERPAPAPVAEVVEEQTPEEPTPLAGLERKLEGHRDWVRSVAVSPDGEWAASGSGDKTVKIWDLATGACRATLAGHKGDANSVALTPDGTRILSASDDQTIRIWDVETGNNLRIIKAHTKTVTCVVPLSNYQKALSSCGDPEQTIKLWDLNSGECLKTLKGHNNSVRSVTITKDGKHAISGSIDKTLKYWNLETGECLATLTGHADIVNSVQITPDGRYAVSGSHDKTVKLWDLAAGTCVGTFEGHQDNIHSVAISPDGALVASTGLTDETVRLWDLHSGACLQVIKPEKEKFVAPISVTFSPDGSRLMAGGATPPTIYVYRLTGVKAVPAAEATTRYVNAKVVLVGESGVGKSGLAYRLIEDEFVITPSTHGMQVWRLDLEPQPTPNPSQEGIPSPTPSHQGRGTDSSLPSRERAEIPHQERRSVSPLPLWEGLGEGAVEREALLWDLAGQEDYRLIHQLFLEETALALVLFNPQKDDPFAEIGDWLKALGAAVATKDAGRESVKLLIAARTDVGSVKISQQKINRFLDEHGFAGYLPTSAKTGDNCSDRLNDDQPSALKRLIAQHLPWNKLPWTATPELLRELKNAVLAMTESDDVRLLRFPELVQESRASVHIDRLVNYAANVMSRPPNVLYAPRLTPTYRYFLRPPRQTGYRVLPNTAYRPPSPCAYQQPLSLIHQALSSQNSQPAWRCSGQLPTGHSGSAFQNTFRPATVSRHEIACGDIRALSRMFIAIWHSCSPHTSSRMVEAWPHAQDEFCCLVRHHFRATPTPRTSMTVSCRCHPACSRLTTGGVSSKNL